jgi:hypothetical protein
MKAVIVYESMFGATREVAQAVAEGLAATSVDIEVSVVNVNETDAAAVAAADLLVVGGPTHVHGMSRPESRAEAAIWADDPERSLTLEPQAPGIGVREWLETLAESDGRYSAAFDTRADFPRILSGAASGAIHKGLHRRGYRDIAGAASFLVSKDGPLEHGERDRARGWGEEIARALTE